MFDKSVQIGHNIFRLTKTGTNYTSIFIRSVSGEDLKAIPILEHRVLGKFESVSEPGRFHSVMKPTVGPIYCTCLGFQSPRACWHYRLIMQYGVHKIKDTIVISLKEIKESDARVKEHNAKMG